jgi:glucosamine-6-phosphate deaminase
MKLVVCNDKNELGKKAAQEAASIIRKSIDEKGEARIVLASAASQMETINFLIEEPGIDWSGVVMFHLDEYIGLSADHPASFRKFLQDRFISRVSGLKEIHFLQGDHSDPQQECDRMNALISQAPIDIALVGIGENGHLAFNDPPADFQVKDPYILVRLDDVCRRQQVGEGWFPGLSEVPEQAISMSIHQIMQSRSIVCIVPDQRKAQAVKNCLEGEVSEWHPASVLQKHDRCTVYLDKESASLLTESL